MIKNIDKRNGFTLVEIIVVLVILAVLAAVTIPSMLGFVKSTDEYVCKSNRGALQRLFKAHALTHNCTMDKFSKGTCDGLTADIKDLSCPSGGVFSADDNILILCSIHKKESAGGGGEIPSIEKIPGTDINLVESYWPTDDMFTEQGANVIVKAGGVFKHTDGKYYVVFKDVSISKGMKPSDVIGWDNTRELTGNIRNDYPDGEGQWQNAKPTDIFMYDGKYYIMKIGSGNTQSYIDSPDKSPSSWYELP